MAFDAKRVCIWHAFDTLDQNKKGTGLKSQLKVLTHNLATSLGVIHEVDTLDQYGDTKTISFSDYLDYLKEKVFSQIPENKEDNGNTNLDKIDEVCWLVCAKCYIKITLSDASKYRLWRVFNFLSDTTPDGAVCYPVVVDYEELLLVIQRLLPQLGGTFISSDFEDLSAPVKLSFHDFVSVIRQRCCRGVDPDLVEVAIQDLYEEYVLQVIKKGLLLKKGHDVLASWRDRWFVLSHRALKYYTSSEQKDCRGTILLNPRLKVESISEKSGTRPYRFQVLCDGRIIEMCASDAKTRTEWTAALRLAIDRCTMATSMQYESLQKRRTSRTTQRTKVQEEEEARRRERQHLMEQLKMLGAEKQTHAEMESKLSAGQSALEAERSRREELEQQQRQLQELLEQERQAKHDEEIVRNLQTRILGEQFEKTDELERLQIEMEEELETERQKRADLEGLRVSQEAAVRDKQAQLDSIQESRRTVDQQLQDALKKLEIAECAKIELQNKIEASSSKTKYTIRARSKSEGSELLPLRISHRGKAASSETEFSPSRTRSSSQHDILDEGMAQT